MSDLIDTAKKAARAIYIAVDKSVADDISEILISLTTELKECQEQLAARDGVLGNIAAGTTDTEYPLRAAPREALMDYARQALNGGSE